MLPDALSNSAAKEKAAASAEEDEDYPGELDSIAARDAQHKLNRDFRKALKTRDAKTCGLAQMFEAIAALPGGGGTKRKARSALAETWRTHSFAEGQYVAASSLTRSQAATATVTYMPRFMVLGLCGGSEAAFADGLACGDIVEVEDPDTGRLKYMVSTSAEIDTAVRSRKLRATNQAAEAVLDNMRAQCRGDRAEGASTSPRRPADGSRLQPPLALQDATAEVKIKLRLEVAKNGAQNLIWKADKVIAGLSSVAELSGFQASVLAQVRAAVVECNAFDEELSAAALKWVTAKMSQEDADAAVGHLQQAKIALDNLDAWTMTGAAVKLPIG